MPDIIADFHGTLYEDPNEGPLWKFVAKRAVTPLPVALVVHPVRTVAFAMAKPRLQELERYDRDEIGYDEIYRAYNSSVLSHLPLQFVTEAIGAYAQLPKTKGKIDHRMLRPVTDAEGKKGILSTGSREFIVNILPGNYGFDSDDVVANPLLKTGDGSVFVLVVYGNKPRIIQEEFFQRRGFDSKNTVYLGDNADEEPAFEYVLDKGGRIAIPFYASDAFRQHATMKYKAFVPENERDLSRFLKAA